MFYAIKSKLIDKSKFMIVRFQERSTQSSKTSEEFLIFDFGNREKYEKFIDFWFTFLCLNCKKFISLRDKNLKCLVVGFVHNKLSLGVFYNRFLLLIGLRVGTARSIERGPTAKLVSLSCFAKRYSISFETQRAKQINM